MFVTGDFRRVSFICKKNIRAESLLHQRCSSVGLLYGIVVLSTELIIGHRKEIRELTFRALVLRRSESSFRISLRWPIHIINPAYKTKLSCYTHHRRSSTVSLGTYPFLYGSHAASLFMQECNCVE